MNNLIDSIDKLMIVEEGKRKLSDVRSEMDELRKKIRQISILANDDLAFADWIETQPKELISAISSIQINIIEKPKGQNPKKQKNDDIETNFSYFCRIIERDMRKIRSEESTPELIMHVYEKSAWVLGDEISQSFIGLELPDNATKTMEIVSNHQNITIRPILLNLSETIKISEKLVNWSKLQFIGIIVEYYDALIVRWRSAGKRPPTWKSVYDVFNTGNNGSLLVPWNSEYAAKISRVYRLTKKYNYLALLSVPFSYLILHCAQLETELTINHELGSLFGGTFENIPWNIGIRNWGIK